MNEYEDIWELYGLGNDPFFTEPLSLFGGIDIRVGFVGREEEVRRLQVLMGGSGGGRILVTGNVGVGKTTFVNFVRASAPSKQFFTPLKEIQTQPEWTGTDFVLNTLAAIHNTIKLRSDLDSKQISQEIWKKLELLVDIVERKDRNFSLDVLSVGGGYGTSTTINVPTPTINSLHVFFEQLVAEIQKMGFRQVILSYNNLEIIEPKDLTRLFNSVRDFIQTKNTKFIFIGGSSVSETISNIPRVQSIMTESPIVLQNLSLTQIKELLEKRIHYLSISGLIPKKPYKDDAISTLYSLYGGNLRFILNAMSTAIKEVVRDVPLVVSSEDVKQILPEVAKNRWLNKLTTQEQEVLMYILHTGEVNNKKIATDLKKQKQNVSPITKKLKELSAIKSRVEGTEKFFTAEFDIKWFLLQNERKSQPQSEVKVSNEVQKVLGNFPL
ncbi:orc1/cdc6 family replication initiation protein [Candidatus Woesearchaeota archaeon]|nr:orc1/cdc6 family replication initiation protein [Candidatus Woesearchaeota archaeon]